MSRRAVRPAARLECINSRCATRGGFRWTCRECGRRACQQHCTGKRAADGSAVCQTCARAADKTPLAR